MSLLYPTYPAVICSNSSNPIENFNVPIVSNEFIPMTEPNLVRIADKTTEFIQGIEKKLLKHAENLNIKDLKHLIQIISQEGVTPFEDALVKKSGYFTRFFSDESWEDWTDYRTPLGKIVSMYCDYITSSNEPIPCIRRLDKKILEVANRDAAEILKSLRMTQEPELQEASDRSFGSSFHFLPMAQAAPLGKSRSPANFNLSSLDGENGFILNGEAAMSFSGYSVSGAGDINGDGIADLIVSAPNASPIDKTKAGKSYVIFGSTRRWRSPLNLSDLIGSNGFIINGENARDDSGWSVRGAGDINGDAIDDLVVGAPFAHKTRSKSYVIFGKKRKWDSHIDLSNLNGVNGFILNGEAGPDLNGFSVSGIGDINGDGIADLIVGAPNASLIGRPWVGKSYVIFGKKGNWNSPIDLSSLNGVNGFILIGEAMFEQSGSSVSGGGDFNDDGIADFVVGAPGASSPGRVNAAKSYVIFGKKGDWNSTLELSKIDGVNGVIFNGENSIGASGCSVSIAGDINGDGIADLIVGNPLASFNNRLSAGKSYVVFGRRIGSWKIPFELSSLNGKNGFILNGEATNDESGWSVSGAGDINDDGIDDLIIGAPYGKTGKSYVIYGSKKSWNSPIELSSLNGVNGFILNGDSGKNWIGFSVSGAGDINDDGIDDLAIGAPDANPHNRTSAGKTYIVFGKKTT